MRNSWFISDPHLNHKNILTFRNFDGTPTRPLWFVEDKTNEALLNEKVQEMNAFILDALCSSVRNGDSLYCLGDVYMGDTPSFRRMWAQVPGRKTLILGNHDNCKELINLFKKVLVWRVFKEQNFTCSHIPMHPLSIKGQFNVHGHVHANDVKNDFGFFDRRYINISVEKTGFKPIHLDEILQIIKDRT